MIRQADVIALGVPAYYGAAFGINALHITSWKDGLRLGTRCGLNENMRVIMRACVSDFREMTPHGMDNFCCGGGSGILFDVPEMYQRRIQLSQK